MEGKRYTTEQKIRILREAGSSDKTIQDVCRERQISEQTFHRWKREMGMLEVDQAKQLKELQRENARLKRMLADEMLGKELLKGSSGKKLGAPDTSVRASLQACRRKQHTRGTSGIGTSFTTQQSVGANSECSILLMSILTNACASMWIVESMLEKCVACSRS